MEQAEEIEKMESIENKIRSEIKNLQNIVFPIDKEFSCCYKLTNLSKNDYSFTLFTKDKTIEFARESQVPVNCTMTLSHSDFFDLFKYSYHSYYLAWKGKIKVEGDKTVMVWFDNLLFNRSEFTGNSQAGHYSALARLFPEPQFQFMNLGYADEFSNPASSDVWHYCKELLEETIWRKNLDYASILEVGSGRGGNVEYLANKFSNSHVTGIDSCKESISFSKINCNNKRTQFIAGDACHLPYNKEAFDYIINLESAHCYSDILSFLRSVYIALKPNGKFFLTDILKANRVVEMIPILEMVGFKIEDQKDVSEGVIRAIKMNRENFKNFLETRKNEDNEWILDNLINSVNQHFLDSLSQKHTVYYSWLLRKN